MLFFLRENTPNIVVNIDQKKSLSPLLTPPNLKIPFFYTGLPLSSTRKQRFKKQPKPSEYPNVLKISAGDYWCIQNNGWSIDSATEIFSEEWISDDEFFVTESEIYGIIINCIIN